MEPTRIKICGVTRPDDAALAAELGADAIGLNFVGGPRRITLELATEIEKRLPPLTARVSLLGAGNLEATEWRDIEKFARWDDYLHSRPSYVQLYAFEQMIADPQSILHAKDSLRVWPVVHVANRQFAAEIKRLLDLFVASNPIATRPSAVVLDTASAEKLGGTGESFDWHWIAEARQAGELEGLPPIVLAGGLKPDNVAEAIRIARPYAVDVSSGVEVAGKPGVKDSIKLRDFIQAVRGA